MTKTKPERLDLGTLNLGGFCLLGARIEMDDFVKDKGKKTGYLNLLVAEALLNRALKYGGVDPMGLAEDYARLDTLKRELRDGKC